MTKEEFREYWKKNYKKILTDNGVEIKSVKEEREQRDRD